MGGNKSIKILGILTAVVLLFLVLTGLFGLNERLAPNPLNKFWLSRFEIWIVLGIVFVFAKKAERDDFLLWKEQKKKALFYVLAVLAVIVLVTVLLTGISLLLQHSGISINNKALNKMSELLCGNLTLLIFTCITAAVTEELMFRGYMLPRLDVVFNNKWISVFLSAFLFGLVHIGYGDLERMLFPFIIGLIFGIFYYRYRSLSVLIVCHFLMDFYSTWGACK